MRNDIFNSVFENMLRIMLLMSVVDKPANMDRLTSLDFMCIYGEKCNVLPSNLHGNNEFGFAEFAIKRQRIAEALRNAVLNNYVTVNQSQEGFLYSLNERGSTIVDNIQTPYSKAYLSDAKVVVMRFEKETDENILTYISKLAANTVGV